MAENTRTFVVHDVITISREVRVPKRCRKCRANLTKASMLRIWEFQDRSAHLTIDESGQRDWETSDSGDSSIELSISCANCGEAFGVGKEVLLDGVLMPDAAKELIKIFENAQELARVR